MGDYRVSAWDINTNTLITDVQATGVNYEVRLNDAGAFGFDVNLTDPVARGSAQQILSLAGNPFKTLITADGNQRILYSGIAWQSTRDPSKSSLTIGGKALTSYYNQTVIAKDYTASIRPGQLVANAVNDLRAADHTYAPLCTPVIQGLNSPPNVTPAYHRNQYPTVAQILADMTAAITPGTGGTDYYMADSFINGAPRHNLTIASPRAGRDQNHSGLSVNLGHALKWTWPTDNLQSGNHVIVVGGGTGGAQPVATADDPSPRGGKGQPPRLDMVLQYNHISSKSQLTSIASGDSQRFGKPIATPVVTIPANYPGCALGSFIIGDDIRVTSGPNVWFPNGFSQWWRVVAYKVTIPDQGVATVDLTLNPPPVF